MSTFLAVDFGAGSGRVIAGRVAGGQLELDELQYGWADMCTGTSLPCSRR